MGVAYGLGKAARWCELCSLQSSGGKCPTRCLGEFELQPTVQRHARPTLHAPCHALAYECGAAISCIALRRCDARQSSSAVSNEVPAEYGCRPTCSCIRPIFGYVRLPDVGRGPRLVCVISRAPASRSGGSRGQQVIGDEGRHACRSGSRTQACHQRLRCMCAMPMSMSMSMLLMTRLGTSG